MPQVFAEPQYWAVRVSGAWVEQGTWSDFQGGWDDLRTLGTCTAQARRASGYGKGRAWAHERPASG